MDLKSQVAVELDLQLNIKTAELLEVPPEASLGDFALPCFSFAKNLKKAPNAIAQEFAQKITAGKLIERVEIAGPYVNIFLRREAVSELVISEVLKKREVFGAKCSSGEKVMVEYSQPNSHKAFHVGHIRNTSMGEALSRILTYAGKDVVQANYSGDTGMHVAKWIWCYQQFHKEEEPPKEFGKLGKWLASIYVEAVGKLSENEELQGEVDKINLALDLREDEELMTLWKKTKQWSVDEFIQIYEDLGAHFDIWWWESEMELRGKEVSQELLNKSIAERSEGAIIINLEEYKLGVWVLLRKDGTPLYSAKDIALAEIKFQKYKIDRAVYVIGAAQSMHMKQLFKTLELMGFEQAKKCFHLSYEEVRLPEGKMSSRTGNNILYNDLRDEVFAVAREGVKIRHEDWNDEQVETAVCAIGICAMKFEMIFRDNNKPVVFDAKKVCDFEGDTGPYIQYTNARCNSILTKLDKKIEGFDLTLLTADKEYALVKMLERFPLVIKEIATNYEPSLLARYALELAKLFSTFYHECKVVGEEENVEMARAALVMATQTVLDRSLYLLGIKAPAQM